jgi:putative DNA primase/helicase
MMDVLNKKTAYMARNTIGEESVLMRSHLLQAGKIQHTDRTNAQRLIEMHGDDIRYNAAWKKWLVWNGRYWKTDESTALIHGLGLDVINKMYGEMTLTDDKQERLELEKFAVLSESIRRRKAFIETASVTEKVNLTSTDLDMNPWLFNVENGTFDISSGEFREQRQTDLITKIANVRYDPQADCPLWKQFIREIMDYKQELTDFLQTAAGWAVTGDTSEQVMFILFGSGANGKSTFLNTLQYILGDYAITAQTETFMKQQGDKMMNDLARLRGTRFVVTAEADQGARLSEPLIKQITGNDRPTARFLYGEPFSYSPTFKIFMASNHKPLIKGSDYGIWRRIRLIPFTTTVAEDRQDKYLEQKLKAEGSGILNWLFEGAMRWGLEGLKTPAAITNATDEYRGEMDVIGNFIKERCVQSPGAQVRIRELFKAYQDWCGERNEHAMSERFFGLRLKETGFTQSRNAEAVSGPVYSYAPDVIFFFSPARPFEFRVTTFYVIPPLVKTDKE